MQNSGNPVLDSFVNLAANGCAQVVSTSSTDGLEKLHALVLELANKEPGGLVIRLPQGSRKPDA